MRQIETAVVGAVDMKDTSAGEASQRLRGMFLDVPGTRLSVADAARLSGFERSLCQQVLETLMDACFLKRGQDGTFTIR